MLVAFRVTFVVVFPKNTWRREEEVGKKTKKTGGREKKIGKKKKKKKRNKPGDKQRVRTKSFSLSLCFREMALFFPLIFNNISR